MKATPSLLLILAAIGGCAVFWWASGASDHQTRQSSELTAPFLPVDRPPTLSELQRFLEVHPQDAKANYLAGAMRAQTEPEPAKVHLEIALADPTYEQPARKLLAAIALTQNDIGAAREHLDQLRILMPDDSAVMLGSAECELRAGNYERALTYARQAASLQPDRAETFLLIAEILDEMGRVPESIAPLQDAIDRDSELFAARANLAYAFHFVGEHQQALSQLGWCRKRQPENVDLMRMQAEILRDDGNVSQARQILQSALELAPNDIGCRLLEGEILLFEDNAPEALKVLEPLLNDDPDNHHLTMLVSRAASRSGDLEKARRYQDRLLRQLPPRSSAP